MAKTTTPDTIIIVDDELHNMAWMIDYIESKKLKVKTATNVNEAIELLSENIYRAAIIDLNIPVLPPLVETVIAAGLVYSQFPGLFVANFARNKGYRSRQTVIYSVHRDASVSNEANNIRCTYIVKGRPREIKEELEDILSYDPTTD